MASRHCLRLTSALAASLVWLLAACTPTQMPEEPAPSAPVSAPVDVSPPIDFQAVIRRVNQSFRAESGAFTSGQGTYSVRVDAGGTLQVSPRHVREGQDAPVTGAPLKVRTASVSRGGQALAKAARTSVRDDGALALERGPVVEVLQNGDAGLEQRWELAARPEGSGDLEVRVELTGMEYVSETAQGHHFADRQSGLGARYGRATWVDAAGTRTPVAAVREGDALVLRVPARVLEESSYPAVLDPIISPEMSADSPVPAPIRYTQVNPVVAVGDGTLLVVWQHFAGFDPAVMGTRVRISDGAVLDITGLLLAEYTSTQSHPAVASNGTDFLVTWVADSHLRGVRVSGATGQRLGSTLSLTSGGEPEQSPAIAFDGTHYFVVWQGGDPLFSAANIYGARVRASDGVVLDPSGIPISTATRDQVEPAVSFDGTRFLVAWSDFRNSNGSYDIYGARVSVDGTVLDPAGIAISTAPGIQHFPSIASVAGTFLVTWDDSHNPYRSNLYIYGARVRSADGAVLDPQALALFTDARVSGSKPSVASDGSRFLVVWQAEFSSRSDIKGARVEADGTVLDPQGVPLAASSTNDERAPVAVFDGTHFRVVWSNNLDGSVDIFGIRVQASDLKVLDASPLLVSAVINSEDFPAVAAGTESYLVVWSDTRDLVGAYRIHGVRVRASDGVVLDPVAIPMGVAARSASAPPPPSVAFEDGRFLVTWMDSPNPYDTNILGVRIRESDGKVLDTPAISVGAGAHLQARPKVASGDGLFFVTWEDSLNGGVTTMDVYGARVRASDGTVLDPNGIVVAKGNYAESRPATAFGDGYFLVAWADYRDGFSVSTIRAARVRASDGTVADSQGLPLSTQYFLRSSPTVAFDGGQFLTVWHDAERGSVHGARVRARDGALLDGNGRALFTNTPSFSRAVPALAFDGNAFLVVWRESPGGGSKLMGGRLAPDLSPVDATPFLISNLNETWGRSSVPMVASWGRGRFLVTYESYAAEFAQFRAAFRLVSDPVNGAKCANGPDCASGFCVEGVCCPSACEGGTCGGGTCTQVPWSITCPGDVVAEASSASGASVSYPAASATGIPPLAVTYSHASESVFALSNTSVTASLMDGAGRTASCGFTVTVQDTTPPSLSCPADVAVEATSLQGATVTYAAASASDPVSDVTVEYSTASGSHFEVGSTPVQVRAKDGVGNSAACAFTVTVVLPHPPTITCPVPVEVEATSARGATVVYPPATPSGRELLVVTYSQASGSVFALGATSVTATVVDGIGRTASCGFSVTVRDTTAPTLTCPEAVVAEAVGRTGAPVSFPPPSVTDAVTATPTLSLSHESGSMFPLGTTSLTATATDAAGNSATCSFPITVRDTTPPSLSCPADVAVEATSLQGATVTYSASASDPVSDVTVEYGTASGSHFEVGSTPVQVRATDIAGNSAACTFTVTVSLPPSPTITCPAPVMAEATSARGANVVYPPAMPTGRGPLVVTYSQDSGTEFHLGTTSVRATVKDGLGRFNSCLFTVTVRDMDAPSVSCPSDVVAEATGPSGASVVLPLPTATDAITPSPSVWLSHVSGSVFPLGLTWVTGNAMDGAGNLSTCSFRVTVRDTTAPALSCGQDVVAEATGRFGTSVDFAAPTAVDAVTPKAVLVVSHEPGALFPLGTTRVSAKATDAAGNAAQCSFTVTVRDTTAPDVGCPAPMVLEAQDTTGTRAVFSVPAPRDTVTMSPIVSMSHAPGSLFPLGTTEVVLSATDDAGNTGSCSFTVSVQDTSPPVLTCPAPVQRADAPAQGLAVDYPAAIAQDAASTPALSYSHASGAVFPVGTTQVTVTATDDAGNSATCTFPVSVSARVQLPPDEPTPDEPLPTGGCGCGSSSGTSAGLSWSGLLMLAWGVTRRRRSRMGGQEGRA